MEPRHLRCGDTGAQIQQLHSPFLRLDQSDQREQEVFHDEPIDQRDSPDTQLGEADRELRSRLAQFHGFRVQESGSDVVLAKCCLTQVIGDETQVAMTHLLPRGSCTPIVEFLEVNKLQNGTDNFGNLILLANNIKSAYDTQRCCFIMDNDDRSNHQCRPLSPQQQNFSPSAAAVVLAAPSWVVVVLCSLFLIFFQQSRHGHLGWYL